MFCVHRVDDAKLISDLTDMGPEVTDPGAAFTTLLEGCQVPDQRKLCLPLDHG